MNQSEPFFPVGYGWSHCGSLVSVNFLVPKSHRTTCPTCPTVGSFWVREVSIWRDRNIRDCQDCISPFTAVHPGEGDLRTHAHTVVFLPGTWSWAPAQGQWTESTSLTMWNQSSQRPNNPKSLKMTIWVQWIPKVCRFPKLNERWRSGHQGGRREVRGLWAQRRMQVRSGEFLGLQRAPHHFILGSPWKRQTQVW